MKNKSDAIQTKQAVGRLARKLVKMRGENSGLIAEISENRKVITAKDVYRIFLCYSKELVIWTKMSVLANKREARNQ